MAASSVRSETTLVVADADSRERLLEVPVDQGTEVTLAYTHSVQKTPVEDVYVVDGTELRADRSVFHSFGAGLPTENVTRTDEGYVVSGSGSHEELFVVPGTIAGHELVVGGDRYDLVETADGGVVLTLAERTASDSLADWVSTVDARSVNHISNEASASTGAPLS